MLKYKKLIKRAITKNNGIIFKWTIKIVIFKKDLFIKPIIKC